MSTDHPTDGSSTDSQSIPDKDAALADELGLDVGQAVDIADLQEIVDHLGEREFDPVVATLLEALVDQLGHLQARVEDLEAEQERTHDIATTASGKAETNASELDALDERESKTRDIAKTAVAKTNQLEEDSDDTGTGTSDQPLPDGIKPSSSPLDFFANARQSKVKEVFVERSNRQNTYRAIAVAKRWPEFATERADGSGVFFTKDDLTTALTAELGREPHRQTVRRVWDKLRNLGGDDVVAKTRRVGRTQMQTEILEMDITTAEGLLEKRYVGLDLLEGTAQKATTGGVTPVVTGQSGESL